jgi:adenylate cyclase
MPAAQPPRGPSRQALLKEVQTLRQRVAALEQEIHDLEVMLEMATEHADDLSEVLQQERDDLETVLEITTDHGDINTEALWQERDDLETMLEMTTDHADALEADLQSQAEALARRSQFIRQTFGRYVSEEVVAQLLDAPEGFELGGELRQVTTLMSDLRGFTALAECLAPQEVMTFLNRYLEAMVDVILAYRGTIIEILGDGLLVLFGAPLSRDDDAERAVACALAMQLRLHDTNAPNRQAGLPEVDMGIGIHTGEVVVGHIGSQQRTKYGVVGSAVNLTGRIEAYTTGGQILISPTTYAATAALLTVSHQLTVEPKGIAAPITLYAVSGIGGTHALYLPTPTETLVLLPQALDVRYSVLEGKFVGSPVSGGHLVKLAPKTAELHLQQPVAALSNLKLHLLRPSGEVVPGELFAKVVETLPDDASRVVVRFTSIPEAAWTFLDTLRGYEYHVINRAEQV